MKFHKNLILILSPAGWGKGILGDDVFETIKISVKKYMRDVISEKPKINRLQISLIYHIQKERFRSRPIAATV